MTQFLTPLGLAGLSRRWKTILALGLLACSATQLGGQQSASPTDLPVVPGVRIRVIARGLVTPLMASFLQQKGDTAIFIEEGVGRGVWSLAVDEIISIEQSVGVRRMNKLRMRNWALIGLLPGTALGLTYASLFSPSDTTLKYSSVSSSLVGMAAGGLVGAAIGAWFTEEAWTPVALPRRVAFIPGRRGGRVAISFSF